MEAAFQFPRQNVPFFRELGFAVWLTIKQAADYLAISTKRLARLVDRGKLPARREGEQGCKRTGRYYFKTEWLDAYAEANTTSPAPSIPKAISEPRKPGPKPKPAPTPVGEPRTDGPLTAFRDQWTRKT